MYYQEILNIVCFSHQNKYFEYNFYYTTFKLLLNYYRTANRACTHRIYSFCSWHCASSFQNIKLSLTLAKSATRVVKDVIQNEYTALTRSVVPFTPGKIKKQIKYVERKEAEIGQGERGKRGRERRGGGRGGRGDVQCMVQIIRFNALRSIQQQNASLHSFSL